MSQKKKLNISAKIIISTIVFILYNLLAHAFFFESHLNYIWPEKYFSICYAVIYLPAFILYFYFVLKNISNVKYIRWLIYPLVLTMFFVGIGMLSAEFFPSLFIYVYFGFSFFIGMFFFVLLAIECKAIPLDIMDFKQAHKADAIKNEKEKI